MCLQLLLLFEVDQSSQLDEPENIVAVFTVLPHLARSRNMIMKVSSGI